MKYHCKCGAVYLGNVLPPFCIVCGQKSFLQQETVEPKIEITFDGVKDFLKGKVEVKGEMEVTYVSPLLALLTEDSWAGNVYRAPSMEERMIRADRAMRNDAEVQMRASRGLDPRSIEMALMYSAYFFLSQMADEACEELTRCRTR